MALIQCPECGGNLSELAKACVHCGYPIAEINAEREAKLQAFRSIGGIATFGTYPQTAEGAEQEAIEWKVLDYDATANKSLLLCRSGLDAKPYHKELTGITWENSTLRTWLNNGFLSKAFSEEERSAILTTEVNNDIKQGVMRWDSFGGNNTQDKVFLLSYAETNKYLKVKYGTCGSISSAVIPTVYALRKGAYTSDTEKTADSSATGLWWLRSPGCGQYQAADILPDGSLGYYFVNDARICVRPALWLNLESI